MAVHMYSNRASDRHTHKTTTKRRERKKAHRNQYQCKRAFFLSKCTVQIVAFGLTAFYSSQLDMVFKWRKSNSFKWIAIIVRGEEKNSWESKRHHTPYRKCNALYDILTRCCWCCWRWSNDRRKWRKCSASVLVSFFVLSSTNRIKNWVYLREFKFSTPQKFF